MLLLLYPALAVLLSVAVLLLLPGLAPLRSSLVPLLSHLSLPLYVLLAVGGLLLSSSYVEWQRHRRALSSSSSPAMGGAEFLSHSVRLAEAELQLTLATALLLLTAAIARIAGLLREQARLSASLTAMQQQAKGAANAYLSSLTPQPPAAAAAASTRSTSPTQTTASAPSSASVAELSAENGRLQLRLQAMERQARSASEAFLSSDAVKGGERGQQVEVLKAQVVALQKELDRGREEQKRLQVQLEDYNLVLGDARKKIM